jgi:outer membrane receptor protein involved in Fe transport
VSILVPFVRVAAHVPSALLSLSFVLTAGVYAQEPEGAHSEKGTESSKQEVAKAEDKAGEELGETVIIATRYPESTFDVPLSVTVVDKQEILEHNARTAAEALRYKAGIWIQKTGHLGGAPVLRGFMGNQVLYMFDGIRRNTAGLFAGPNSFLQNIDALDIDRIEVVRGPGSVLYGSDAIGGVINVISNEKPLFSDEPTFGGSFFSRYASVDREMSSRLEGYFSDQNLYAFVGSTYRDISDLKGGRGIGVQSPSGWREKNLDAQINYRLDSDSTMELFLQDFSRPVGFRYDRPNWVQSNDRQLIGARYKTRDLGFMDDLEVTGYYHEQKSFIDEKFWDSDSTDETVGLDMQATSFPNDDLRLTYGVHFNRDDVVKSNPQKGTVDPDVQWDNPAVFMLSEWQATDDLRLDLGVRWDSFTLTSTAPQFGELDSALQDAITNGAFTLDDLELDETDMALTGGLGAVYSLTDHTNLFGHIGRAFRAPNKSDLLSFGQFSFGFGVPALNLKPESSLTYELGVRTEKDNFAGSVTAFYTEVKDAIISAPGTFNGSDFIDVDGNGNFDPGEGVFVKSNSPGTVTATGVELEGRQYFPEAWNSTLVGSNALSWYGNFSWIYGKDTGNDEPLDRAYPANALLGLRLDESRHPSESDYWIELETWLVRSFSRIPSSRLNKDGAFKNDPQDPGSGLLGGDGTVPGFGIVNLRGGRRLTKNATLYLGAENLTDRAYRVKDSRIDGAGMNFVIGLRVSF